MDNTHRHGQWNNETIRKMDKNIKIPYKTNNKMNNVISKKIEQFNKYNRKWVYKLTCTNHNKFYIGRTNRNFNTRFTEHRKDFKHAESKSKFSDKEGHEMKTIEETMSRIQLENNHWKINMLEEIEILKAASSKYLLNDDITRRNDPMHRLSPSVSDINSNSQLPKLGDTRNFGNQQDLLKMSLKWWNAYEEPIQLIECDDGEAWY
jgi:GIY-YIG catalytic domain.